MGTKGQARRRWGQDRDAEAMQALLDRVNCNDRREHDTQIEEATLKARQLAAVTYVSVFL
ncbi:hypothetical protein GCM10010330_79620 [Streptomyces tendae]|uniref:hypothetical protein n=1 Tax=Streptomyces tendae TaxID=1932 RepID=UPI0016724F41|nr:hypothetical protein [Streptomyces tendae]GHB13852.1 hypothetical protein GCM10010330_79620 [Streptomyces tendae]